MSVLICRLVATSPSISCWIIRPLDTPLSGNILCHPLYEPQDPAPTMALSSLVNAPLCLSLPP